jgi:hypothetical protein
MSTYLLDFTATPLKPEAGGQLHRVKVGTGAHDSVEAAVADLVLKYGLVGETPDHVPLAKVTCANVIGSRPLEVLVEPASAAPDYDPDPVKPTAAEVLAAFPLAKDISVTGHTPPKRCFRLHQTRFIVGPADNDQWHVESMDKDNDLEFCRYHSALPWPATVRLLARIVLDNERDEIARLTAEAAALEAAIGGA